MIKSMTAFSQGSHTFGTITADVTIRSYNSRHLDIAFYCPESCQVFEDNIKKIIAKTHDRGRIEIRLSVQDDAQDLDQFEVDGAKAISYYQALKKIQHDLNLSGDISVDNILTARNVIVPSKKEQDSENLWNAIEPSVETASSHLEIMRKTEGENLLLDLTARMDYIEKNLALIEADAATIPPIYKQRLMDRVSYLTSDTEGLDPVRIAQEAAILADKSDVSEEIVRLYSHIKQFRDILDSEEAGGRKLNFLIQEFNREFNTIGSKAGNASLSHKVVDLKSELEKIREQVQNIE
ncbi:YicC/YloC family endoribonuclease [Desulfobacula phenolica]|uniref:TIGR00255 family protein n=1 Tax=Desulfobacula phenolica TaxID=90732 RepID=A0A1H2GRT8_9BACT|nr:YicC/YloC family endoribonuclease [Desulfobacula phenolica]SDU22337.1 TIGR00255 family protein [Desulfobacula phenolica]